jgi:surfactin synthase thioesterase subunit
MVLDSTAAVVARAANPSAAPLRLFCFHHAGGHESAFFGWQRKLGARTEVVPVRLPRPEPAPHQGSCEGAADMAYVVEALDRELGPLRQPYAFYGHSMGALVAYHLACLRQSRGRSLPERLLVGAYPAPHLPHRLAGSAGLPDEDLLALLPQQPMHRARLLSEAPGLAAAAAARLRTHLGICDSATQSAPFRQEPAARGTPDPGSEPLRCPIEVFTGISDPLVTDVEAAAWRQHTRAGCRVHRIPGGHFFTRENPESRTTFFDRLSAVLADTSQYAAKTPWFLPTAITAS